MTLIRRLAASTGAAAAAITLAIVPAGEANAAGPSAMDRCLADYQQPFHYRWASRSLEGGRALPLGGGTDWTGRAHGFIKKGHVIRVQAWGQVGIDGNFWSPTFGPEGENRPAPSLFPASGRPQFSLIGTFNATGEQHVLGRRSACIEYTGPDTFLWLEMNDDWTLDNTGSWGVRLHQYWS